MGTRNYKTVNPRITTIPENYYTILEPIKDMDQTQTHKLVNIGDLRRILELPDELRLMIFQHAFYRRSYSKKYWEVNWNHLERFLQAVPRLPNAAPNDQWGGWQEVLGWRFIQPMIIRPAAYRSFEAFMKKPPQQLMFTYVQTVDHHEVWELLDYQCEECMCYSVCICSFWRKYDAVSREHLAELRQEKNDPNYGSKERLLSESEEAWQIYDYTMMKSSISMNSLIYSRVKNKLFVLDAILKWPRELTRVHGKSLLHTIIYELFNMMRCSYMIRPYDKSDYPIWVKIKERMWLLYQLYYRQLSTPDILCAAIHLDMWTCPTLYTQTIIPQWPYHVEKIHAPEIFLAKEMLCFNNGRQFSYLRVDPDLHKLNTTEIKEYFSAKLANVGVFKILNMLHAYHNPVVKILLLNNYEWIYDQTNYCGLFKDRKQTTVEERVYMLIHAKYYQWILNELACILLVPPKIPTEENTNIRQAWFRLGHVIEKIHKVYYHSQHGGLLGHDYWNSNYSDLYHKYWQFF